MAKEQKFNIKVERELYTSKKTGKSNYTYFIKGVIRSKDVKIAVTPPDFGGYTVLDIVFNDAMQADLVVKPFEMKDDAGNVIAGNTYSVISIDADGKVYECKIKPFRSSDKQLLTMLLG